jgi:hypothetical protein
MKSRVFIFLLQAIFTACYNHLSAQEKEIHMGVGDSLLLGTCTDSSTYKSIDLLIKTRFPNPGQSYNKETGEGFYDWFFNGDTDARRLPCSYAGNWFRVVSIYSFDENGAARTVVFGQLTDENTVLWIEIENAAMLGEVLLP